MPSADYVIVGAGSAGCVLANRLSEDPGTSVLLLEAGGGKGRHPNVTIPAAFAKQFRTKLDWGFSTEPEPHCDGRELFTPRGKGLGGSSSMNAMLYVRGRALDYDLWESENFGWDQLRPYFLKSEDFDRGASEHHGAGGPLHVQKARSPRKITREFYAAAEAAGIPYTPDYNAGEQDGVSPVQVTQRAGRRWSAADAFLRPVLKRPNLTVVSGAHVEGIEFEGDRAVGIRYTQRAPGRRASQQVARASREVVLSAGSFGSPQLLMLSGIGPAEHLREHGVDVRHDLEGVGQNLQDHPFCVAIWDLPGGGSLADAEKLKHVAEWALRRTGPLASTVAEAFAFVRTRPGLPAADIQFHFAPAYFVDHGEAEYDGHAITMGPTLVSPKSRGSVTLRSGRYDDAPRILTNTFAEPEDLAAMVEGMKLARRIASMEPLAHELGEELFPGADVVDDDALEADLRKRVELLYHPVGTCSIGSVVDDELRVEGVEGLRVVDASIMAVIPGGNTNAPVIAVAERAADLIKAKVPAHA